MRTLADTVVLLLCACALVSCTSASAVDEAVLVANQGAPTPGTLAAETMGSEPIASPASFTTEPLVDGPNSFGALVGGSTSNRNGGGFTLGLDYQYVPINFGAFAEYVAADGSTFAVGAGLFFRVADDFTVILAPGYEFAPGEDSWFGRIGCAYDLPLGGGFTMTPALYGDFKERGEFVLVYGLRFGTRF